MMKKILTISLFFASFHLSAQSYNTAAGLQLGSNNIGMSVQQKVMEKVSIEGIAQKRSEDWNPTVALSSPTTYTALVKKHKYLMGRALNGYVGLGGHTTVLKGADENFGLDGVVGIEGTLFYLNTSIAYRPVVSFVNNQRDFQGQIAVSVRYVLVKAPYGTKRKNKKTNTYPPYKPIWT